MLTLQIVNHALGLSGNSLKNQKNTLWDGNCWLICKILAWTQFSRFAEHAVNNLTHSIHQKLDKLNKTSFSCRDTILFFFYTFTEQSDNHVERAEVTFMSSCVSSNQWLKHDCSNIHRFRSSERLFKSCNFLTRARIFFSVHSPCCAGLYTQHI